MADAVFPAPAAAYRADVQGRAEPFGPSDDEWLAAATELHLAATSAPGDQRHEHLAAATSIAIGLLGDERVAAFAAREWQGQRSDVDAIFILADTIYYGGARHLAARILDDIRAAVPGLTPVQLGRILFRRARITWSLGDIDAAADRFENIGAMGKRARSVELEALAELGLVTLSQFRGDFPDLRVRAARANQLAERTGIPALIRWSLHAVMMSETSQGHFDAAMSAGWRLLGLSRGYAVWEAEAFVNLGQLLVESGHPHRARASFSAAVACPAPPRLLLPALGGLAVASALVAHEPTVEWAVREVWRAQEQTVQPYAVAAAHLECAVALHALGREADAERHRTAAEELARRYGFHEVAFKADALRELPRKAPAPLAPESESIGSALERLAPRRLPAALAFDVAAV